MRAFAVLASVLAVAAPAAAHTDVTASGLALSVGWTEEPAVAGAENGIEVVVRSGFDAENASALGGIALYKGENVANLSFAERSPGRFVAAFTPPHAGRYTVVLDGSLSGREVASTVALPERAHDPLPARGPGSPANLPVHAGLALLALGAAARFAVRR